MRRQRTRASVRFASSNYNALSSREREKSVEKEESKKREERRRAAMIKKGRRRRRHERWMREREREIAGEKGKILSDEKPRG